MKAYLKNYRQSPRKVRLVTDLIRGKKVNDALTTLKFTPKRASKAIIKLISSAAANAGHNFKTEKENLLIKEIAVDEGVTLKRWRARARGRAGRILKRTSNVSIKLADSTVAKTAVKSKKAKEALKRSKASVARTKKVIKPKTVKKATVKKVAKK